MRYAFLVVTVALGALLTSVAWGYPALTVDKSQAVDVFGTYGPVGRPIRDCFQYNIHGMTAEVVQVRADGVGAMATVVFAALNNSGMALPSMGVNFDVYVAGKYRESGMASHPVRADGSPVDYGHVFSRGERAYLEGHVLSIADLANPLDDLKPGDMKADIRVRDVFSMFYDGKGCPRGW